GDVDDITLLNVDRQILVDHELLVGEPKTKAFGDLQHPRRALDRGCEGAIDDVAGHSSNPSIISSGSTTLPSLSRTGAMRAPSVSSSFKVSIAPANAKRSIGVSFLASKNTSARNMPVSRSRPITTMSLRRPWSTSR